MSVSVRSDGYTWADLQQFPEDGMRRELVHGQLLVSPAPTLRHQYAVAELMAILRAAVTPEMVVLTAPCDWAISENTVFEPDLLVLGNRSELDAARVGTPPVLVVEIHSPSTASTDRVLKRHEYAAGGTPNYWLVDLDVPSVTALVLGDDGGYREVASASGDELLSVTEPVPLSFPPAALVP